MSYSIENGYFLNENQLRLLSFDPGSRNMGVSLVCYNKKSKKIQVLANATLEFPIHDIKQIASQKENFLNEVNKWITIFKPHGIIAERFQSRGLKGNTVECVNIMLGLLLSLNLPTKFITASTWKNKFQKRFQVDLREIYKNIATTPHQLDSSLIGCFGIEICAKKDLTNLNLIIEQVKNTSLVSLRRGFTK